MTFNPATFVRPSWWSGAGYTAKAAHLMARYGCDYSTACSLLARMRKPHNTPQTTISRAEYQAVMEKRGLG